MASYLTAVAGPPPRARRSNRGRPSKRRCRTHFSNPPSASGRQNASPLRTGRAPAGIINRFSSLAQLADSFVDHVDPGDRPSHAAGLGSRRPVSPYRDVDAHSQPSDAMSQVDNLVCYFTNLADERRA